MVVLSSEDGVIGSNRIGYWLSALGYWPARLGWVCLWFALICLLLGCGRNENFVVVYTSQDQVYAEPVFEGFTKHTGIEVRAVYDSEAVKTVGLVNRLLAEKNNPQCDVFWNNEELRTRQLEQGGVLRETKPWAAFGHRKRQLVINTNQLNNAECPRTLFGLTNSACRGKVAIAYPLFGTTATHFLALRQSLGEAGWEKWCRALVANNPLLVDGNSVVVKMVGTGEAWIGLTDSDDIKAGLREGLPVQAIDLNEHGFLVRNTVAVIRNAPHPERAEALFEFLQKDVVQEVLKEAGASEGTPTREMAAKMEQLDWGEMLGTQESAVQKLKEIFLR